MKKIEVVLISGRTTEQGSSLEIGKTSEQYFNSVAVIEVSEADAEAIEIDDGDYVEVETSYGSVTVKGRRTESLDQGLAFFPYGPWANQVFNSVTLGTGMPLFKGINATLKPSRGKPLTLDELVAKLRGEN